MRIFYRFLCRPPKVPKFGEKIDCDGISTWWRLVRISKKIDGHINLARSAGILVDSWMIDVVDIYILTMFICSAEQEIKSARLFIHKSNRERNCSCQSIRLENISFSLISLLYSEHEFRSRKMSDSGWESISFAGLIDEKLQMFLQSLVNCFCKSELLNESWQQGWSLKILAGISPFSLLSNLLNKNQSENFQIQSTFGFNLNESHKRTIFHFKASLQRTISVYELSLQKQSRTFFSFQSRF